MDQTIHDMARFDKTVDAQAGPERAAPDAAIQAELNRPWSWRLGFAPALEARFESDSRLERCANIRLATPFGLLGYVAFACADPLVVGPIGLWAIWLPVGLLIIGGVIVMLICARVGARLREASLGFCLILSVMVPIGHLFLSHAALAPYTVVNVLLIATFGNITIRLRFAWACTFSLFVLAAVMLVICLHPAYPAGTAVTMALGTGFGLLFGLVANHQMERTQRIGFLLRLLQTVRADALTIDREKLSRLSLSDPLTGVANRRAFDLRLAELVWHHQTSASPFALLMIDVDHFKSYNDLYGHPAGDVCLTRIAEILRRIAGRRQDLVARYGGEEFAVLLTGAELADARRMGQALCDAVCADAIAHGRRGDALAVVTISVGFCVSAAGPVTALQMLESADLALYDAKRAGRAQVYGNIVGSA